MKLIQFLRILIRFLRFCFFTIWIVIRVLLNARFNKNPLQKGLEIRQQWAKGMISGIYNFQEEIRGEIPKGQHLFISNHRASIDPLVYLQHIKAFPVSRADVAAYPLVGKGATTVGTIFVDKESRSSRAATLRAIEEELEKGNSILLFPEGKTHAEELTERFHLGSFRAAATKGVPILPMAIDYQDQYDYWIHDKNLLTQFNQQFGGRKKTLLKLRFGNPIPPSNAEEMLAKSQSWINEQIINMREEWNGTQILRKK